MLAFTAAVGLLFGTSGFTAMEADRGLAVNVTGDDSAYLGYEPIANETESGASTAVVEYRNQFGSDLTEFDVDVSIADPDSDVSLVTSDAPDHIDQGIAGKVTVTLRCPTRRDVELLFGADGSGSDVSVSVDRTHTVTCVPSGPTVTGVAFDDAANGRVLVDDGNGEVAANVWIAETPPTESVENLTAVAFDEAIPFDTSDKIRKQVVQHPSSEGSGSDWKVVAVEFRDEDLTYVHPGWEAGAYTTPSSGDGVAYEGSVDEEFLSNASVDDGEVVGD
ncbi:hypothetical protein C472_13172 [Halorubrum tebenquichense DSM 14210]|uniref:Uncharacterized protein n=1 Tax=Halorubrum tebenquichense DSM 14210 TaxID=1227485 RepID=M0DGU3_9EURY|nr:hypothetical protein C472_13172 [Halorubrum tebenquichense DSM 14210]